MPSGVGGTPLEHVEVCPDTGFFPVPLSLSSGMFAAFLFDMTDGFGDPEWFFAQDDETALVADNYSDCSRSGWFEILDVTSRAALPMTPDQFVADYASLYPLQRPALYWTAFNITPDYLSTGVFPDAQAPGAVPDAGSRQVGSSPCIPLVVDPPPDDGTGACGYSWEWTQNAAGVSPDLTVDVLGSCTLPGPVLGEGDWYVCIRARDCANNWSSQFATFGPFEIRDCNSNGVTDACEVDCDESFLIDAYNCDIPLNMCDSAPCTPNDCNGNLKPDDCDIAEGTSTDCNLDDIPDDCQEATVRKWVGDKGTWNTPENWSPDSNGQLSLPTHETDVCIESASDEVTIFNFTAKARQMHSVGSILIESAGAGSSLELNAESVVSSQVTVDGGLSTLSAADLEVDTLIMLNNARLAGRMRVVSALEVSGETLSSLGRAILTDAPFENGDLTIGANATVTASTGFNYTIGNERIHVESGAQYNYSGDGVIAQGFGLFENDGTLTRVSGTGTAGVFVDTVNRGTIEIDTGDFTLRGFLSPLENSGVITGAVGTNLSLTSGANLTSTSELSTGLLSFVPGGPSIPTVIRGVLDPRDGISIDGAEVIVDASATVVSYGDDIDVVMGSLTLEPQVGADLVFDQVNAQQTAQITFESTDAI